MRRFIQELLTREHFQFKCIESSTDRDLFIISNDMQNGQFDCLIDQRTLGNPVMLIYTLFPVKIPRNKTNELAVLTTLLNNGLSLGCWEFDIDTASLRFKITYLYDTGSPTLEKYFLFQVRECIQLTNICMPAILSMIFGEKNPEVIYREFLKIPNHQYN